jgi:hypothetical protein
MAKQVQKDGHLKIYLKKTLESEFINSKVFPDAPPPSHFCTFGAPVLLNRRGTMRLYTRKSVISSQNSARQIFCQLKKTPPDTVL